MSDISALHTAQAKTSAPGQGVAGQASALSKGTGLFSGAGIGLNFFDLIFARMTDSAKGENESAQGDPLAQLLTKISQNAADTQIESDAAATLDLAALLGGETVLAADLETAPADPAEPLAETPAILNAKGSSHLQTILANFLRGLPQEYQNMNLKIAPGQAQKLTAAIQAAQENPQDASGLQALIATGLSPQKLTELIEQIAAAAETGEGNALYLAGVLKLLPDGAKNEAIFLPRALILSKNAQVTPSGGTDDSNEELAASLNALTIATPQTAQPAASSAPTLTETAPAESGFEDVLKIFEQIQARGGDAKALLPGVAAGAGGDDLAAALKPGAAAGHAGAPGLLNSTLGSSFHGMLGSMMSGSDLGSQFPDGLDWSQTAPGAVSNTHVSAPAQMTSLITQAQQASQPHPATQVVAASLIRAGQAGEDQNLRLKLDPPELGRIEVHMQFTKDKTMKAHMVIEKPETMLMLQRDAQALERALQEAGMDMGGSGLSFELADQNQMSGERNDHHGGHSGSGSDDAPDDGADLIETTMTWYVDEKTGMQRYNLLA
ncbi:MAG: flagellar hook-length control protein FliK [Micavibrio aeruginosavorus]|nr:flagellar hook-length control protein FliK [Micavibrio aeruginosavorus]